jgi:hypothetical protein
MYLNILLNIQAEKTIQGTQKNSRGYLSCISLELNRVIGIL